DFGYNMLRKHVKTEPDRFYYHCDKHGVLVWQDMPSSYPYIGSNDPDATRTPEADAQFRAELAEMVHSLDNHPCIVIWVPFNEGWGQYNTAEIVEYCRQLDPTRLVNSASGWTDRKVGDMHDIHVYPGPGMPPVEEERAVVLGEYGGLGMPVKDHAWKEDGNWGYQSFEEKEALFDRYQQLNDALHPLIAKGLSAAVYTQTTDVEIEVNGLMSYDRKVDKFDPKRLKEVNDKLHYPAPKVETLVPTGRDKSGQTWKWTTEKPADDWKSANFDDSSWKDGEGGFGGVNPPNTTIRTNWDTKEIWLRRDFDLTASEVKHLVDSADLLRLTIYYDEDCEVYLNGELIFSATGYVTDYTEVAIDSAVLKKSLKSGKNTVAIQCKDTWGGRYIDAGLKIIVPAENSTKRIW
ncbi:MAG: glycoside hydrolase family 2 TIM barrel-domain containing protein, partial [Thermoguttaceae bacterium]